MSVPLAEHDQFTKAIRTLSSCREILENAHVVPLSRCYDSVSYTSRAGELSTAGLSGLSFSLDGLYQPSKTLSLH